MDSVSNFGPDIDQLDSAGIQYATTVSGSMLYVRIKFLFFLFLAKSDVCLSVRTIHTKTFINAVTTSS